MKKLLRLGLSKDSEAKDRKPDNVQAKKESVAFFELFRFATCIDKTFIVLGIIFAIGAAVCNPYMMLIFAEAAGCFVDYAMIAGNSTTTPDEMKVAKDTLYYSLQLFAIIATVLGLLTILFSYISTLLFNYSAQRQIFKIRSTYFEKVLNQDISWYDMHQTGDFVVRITEDLIKLEEGIGEKVSIFIYFISTFISGTVLALFLGWELALICLISFPLSSTAMALINWLTTKFTNNEMDAYGAAGAIVEEAFGAVRTVVAFEGQQKEHDRYKSHLIAAQKNNIKRSIFTSTSNGIMWFMLYGLIALSFWYGTKLVVEGRHLPVDERWYTPSTMMAVFWAVFTASWNFGQCSPYFAIFSVAQNAAFKIFDVIDHEPLINLSKNRGKKPDSITGNISFSNVCFAYPSRSDVKVLQGLNLTIKAGETVALVGSSGCGKSTCVQLIQRFYDPSSGSVYLDGNKLSDLNLMWLREHVGVVGQEPVLFATTIAENIKYGHKEATLQQIETAAKKANAHTFICALPEGYNTMVGERGAQLSGGQKQRIAIARALVREPAILLLDEATSALDTNSESIVQAALDSASKECTTIIVAHRLSTIRGADRIVVLSEGSVAEEGTHDSLMSLNGLYHNLVTRQTTSAENVDEIKNVDGTNGVSQRNGSVVETTTNDGDVNSFAEENRESEKATNGTLLLDVIKLNSPEWIQITIGCVSSLITGAALPLYSIIFGDVIGILANPNDDYVREESHKLCLYFFLIGVFAGIFSFLQMHMFNIAGERLTMRVRSLLFQSMLNQEMGWFDLKENGVGALCTRLSAETAYVQGASGQPIGTILNSASTLVLAVGFAFYFEWRVSLVTLCFTPFIFLSIYLEQKVLNKSVQGDNNFLEESSKIAVEVISNIRTVASLGREATFLEMYEDKLRPHVEKAKKSGHFRGFALGMARGLMFFSYGTSLFYGGTLVVSEGLPYSIVFKVSEALISGAWSMGNAVAFTPNFQKGIIASAKIFKILKRTPAIRDSKDASFLKWEQGKVEFSKVHFSYPTRPNVGVLNGLNLKIERGKSVALVGSSGCGKSTIIQLLQRLYDPEDGAITVEKNNLKNIQLKALRSNFGIVSQEPVLFDRTIEENIAYGDNSRTVDKQDVIEAAKNANIHNFIASLPQGYDTRLGEKGTQLSGGQKQRMAIARALIRNPRVLLLDEATSALDTESEKIVQEALDNAKKDRTCITIAHRLTTIQDADLICVINKGSVEEMGTHSELLAKKGLYYQLQILQK